MQLERHVADFVQKQRAAIGLLKAAAAHGLRAGKSAALVAEEFALQQVFGDGSGVDGHKRAIGARGMLVQRARHQLFAGAGFAGDHHRDVALAQAADGTEHVLHGGRLAQHFGRLGHALFADLFALAFFHRAADQLHRLGQIKRLGQVFKGAALEGAHRAVQVRERRHDDDGQAGVLGFDFFEQVQAGASGHADIAHQDLRAFIVCRSAQRRQYIARIGKAAGRQVLPQQCLLQHEADGLVIIYDPNRLHVVGTLVSLSVCYGNGIRILKSVRPGTLSTSISPWCCCTKVCANVSPSPEPPSLPDTSG